VNLFVIFGTDIESVFKKSNVSGSHAGVYAFLAGCFNASFFFFYARAILLLQAALAAEPRFRLVLKRQIEGIDRVKRQEAGSMGEGGGDQEE
jgi:hypothetical protein